MTTVLVTGASGNVGREVVRACIARGLSVRAAGHDVTRLKTLFGDAVEVVSFDFHDPQTWSLAARDAQHLFLMRPPAIADVANNLNPFVDAAREAGVDHVVFLSVAGAGKNKVVPHRKVEDHLRLRGDRHTNLRPGFFAQNLQSAYRRDIVEDDRIYVPAGRKPVNWIDVRDVAEVAALIFAAPDAHRGQNYTLTGPGPVAWDDVVQTLTEVLGRPVRYEPASVFGYMRHLSRQGLPRGAITVQTVLHFLLRFGQGMTEDPAVEQLLGRPGRKVHDYIRDHGAVWAKANQGRAAA